jgi:hypothetical protein
MPEEFIDEDPKNYTIRPLDRTRLVVQDTISYATPQGETSQDHSNFTHWIKAKDEQPYIRRLTCTDQWEKIPIGWAGEWTACSAFRIENLREVRQVRPTPEEQAAEDAKVIEIMFGSIRESTDIDSVFVISKGESFRGQPKKFDQVRIRCLSGSTRYAISIYPG